MQRLPGWWLASSVLLLVESAAAQGPGFRHGDLYLHAPSLAGPSSIDAALDSSNDVLCSYSFGEVGPGTILAVGVCSSITAGAVATLIVIDPT